MIEVRYGHIKIKLEEMIKKNGISKNKLSHRAEVQRSQINAYCSNSVSRIDLGVLSRLCTEFECRIEDLLEFVPAEESSEIFKEAD